MPFWTLTTQAMKVSWGVLEADDTFSIITTAIINPHRATGHGVYIQHMTPIYSLIILQYILSLCVLMKIKYSFNSMASWGDEGEGIIHRQILGVPRAKSQPLSQAPRLHAWSQENLWLSLVLPQWFSKCGPRPRVPASPGNSLQIQITGPTLDPLNQKLWG